jgi:hypothetical protein
VGSGFSLRRSRFVPGIIQFQCVGFVALFCNGIKCPFVSKKKKKKQ